VRGRPPLDHLAGVPTRRPGAPARDIAALDLDGASWMPELARPGHWTLLLFLGPDCDACEPFWEGAADPGHLGLREGDAVVTLVRDSDDLGAVRRIVAGHPGAPTPAVVSVAAWRAFGVHGPPFFAVVDGTRVAGEGVAWSVEQVAADVAGVRGR